MTRGVAGMPTAFVAEWGSGKPVIGLMADIDGWPETSHKPGVAYEAPLIPGGPGQGEGHNAGQAVQVTAAVMVVKQRFGPPLKKLRYDPARYQSYLEQLGIWYPTTRPRGDNR